ncbi:ATP-binding protein [Clostridium sp. Cult2]|uniref:ATP-binding protein n=1 Tax=Clostridium sp. Cult2 TaxID=2079003 RepID=UPI001F1DDB0F|nr:ATP-binding protein [Clostridium sp. Cult2]MCF6466046.1 hypothetical protein [Clostridium sp. Cult2]
MYNSYPRLAEEHLNISVDTGQILTIDDFVEKYDNNQLNSPLNLNLLNREKEIRELKELVLTNDLVMVSGSPGVGKTRLVIEILRALENTIKDNTIYCIKSRGLNIYKDLKDYIYKPGNYILFIDDANEMNDLEHILEYLNNMREGIGVKIILTVRDYAKKFVMKTVRKASNWEEYKLSTIEDEDIEDILKKNFNMKNNILLKSLFIISLLGPFDYGKDDKFLKVLEFINMAIGDFHNSCIELNNLELVDLYKDKVVKINDQNLKDYLLYYILLDKKIVSITGLFNKEIYVYKYEVLDAIKIILNIFPSEETFKFIKDSIINNAEALEGKDRYKFSQDLIVFDQEWLLLYIKEQIEKLDENIIDLRKYDFESNMNHKTIRSEYIQILSNFKYMKYHGEAIDLILYLVQKNLQNPMDFYFVFTENYGYDEQSYIYDYEKEYLVIDKLWKLSNNGNNINATILLIYIISNYLEYYHDSIGSVTNNKATIIMFNLIINDGLMKLRKKMWEILGQLYKMEVYRSRIEKLLLDYNIYPREGNDNNLKEIFRIDVEFFKINFLKHISEITFIQSDIIYNFKFISKRILGEIPIKLNNNYNLYLTLTKPDEEVEGWEKIDKNIEENIGDMVNDYGKEEFNQLFKALNQIEELDHIEGHDRWVLSNGINKMFNLLDGYQYIMAVESYLLNDTPYDLMPEFILLKLIQICGVEETKRVISKHKFSSKDIWLINYVFVLPKEKLAVETVKQYKYKLINVIKEYENVSPNYYYLIKFVDYDENFILDIGHSLLEIDNEFRRKIKIERFLGYTFNKKEEIDKIFEVFIDDMELLELLYLEVIYTYFDFRGDLFCELAERNKSFLSRSINFILEAKEVELAGKFNRIWYSEVYEELVDIILNEILGEEEYYYLIHQSILEDVFKMTDSESINSRKINYLYKFIDLKYNNLEKIKRIFYVINKIFDVETRAEFLVYIANKDISIGFFKSIPLRPGGVISWVGSEKHLVEKEIYFLEKVKSNLNSVDYIEHKYFIGEVIRGMEKYLENIYIEDYIWENK